MDEFSKFGGLIPERSGIKALNDLADNFITQKGELRISDSNRNLILSPDEKAQKEVAKILAGYKEMLSSWIDDPINPISGNDGYGFELFLTQVLRAVFDEKTVFPAPAYLDFYQQDSADIVIGNQQENGSVIPRLLIATAFKKSSRQTKHIENNTLKVPILNIACNNNWGFFTGPRIICDFGMSSNPAKFAQEQARVFRPHFIKALESPKLSGVVQMITNR